MPPDYDDLETLRDTFIAAAGGLDAALALLQDMAARGRGRPPNDDDALLVRINEHLRDPDLRTRAVAGRRILSEAIRRAIRDLPADGDIQEYGRVAPETVQRLLRKFNFFCLDVPSRGWDEERAEWAPPELLRT